MRGGSVKEGQRVRVRFAESAPGVPPSLGVVRYACTAVGGVFVELDAPATDAAVSRLRFNGGDRLVLAYHREVEPA
jgi:hypothetical protein